VGVVIVEVDIALHHMVGTELRTTFIKGIVRSEAEKFLENIGRVRSQNGCITVGGGSKVQAMIPAQKIELAEITREVFR
jgi:CRISPR/Cas system CMR subunit Cmr6 (Cas7 group RAMP superfamily)